MQTAAEKSFIDTFRLGSLPEQQQTAILGALAGINPDNLTKFSQGYAYLRRQDNTADSAARRAFAEIHGPTAEADKKKLIAALNSARVQEGMYGKPALLDIHLVTKAVTGAGFDPTLAITAQEARVRAHEALQMARVNTTPPAPILPAADVTAGNTRLNLGLPTAATTIAAAVPAPGMPTMAVRASPPDPRPPHPLPPSRQAQRNHRTAIPHQVADASPLSTEQRDRIAAVWAIRTNGDPTFVDNGGTLPNQGTTTYAARNGKPAVTATNLPPIKPGPKITV